MAPRSLRGLLLFLSLVILVHVDVLGTIVTRLVLLPLGFWVCHDSVGVCHDSVACVIVGHQHLGRVAGRLLVRLDSVCDEVDLAIGSRSLLYRSFMDLICLCHCDHSLSVILGICCMRHRLLVLVVSVLLGELGLFRGLFCILQNLWEVFRLLRVLRLHEFVQSRVRLVHNALHLLPALRKLFELRVCRVSSSTCTIILTPLRFELRSSGSLGFCKFECLPGLILLLHSADLSLCSICMSDLDGRHAQLCTPRVTLVSYVVVCDIELVPVFSLDVFKA